MGDQYGDGELAMITETVLNSPDFVYTIPARRSIQRSVEEHWK